MKVPLLREAPVERWCKVLREGQPVFMRCLMVLKDDWDEIVRELKASCIAHGNSLEDCQAVEVEK